MTAYTYSGTKPSFESVSDAINEGYTTGESFRKDGAKLEEINDQIEVAGAIYVRDQYYEFWKKAFIAGYQGKEKPKV